MDAAQPSDPGHLTQLLRSANAGSREASSQLLPLVYERLRLIAQARMNNERPEHTLQATALVHEAYMRLIGDERLNDSDRSTFYRCAAEAMQRILIEHARARNASKRGGGSRRLPLDVLDLAADADPATIVALDEAFLRLSEQDSVASEVARLRFFAGLSVEQTSAALGISERTVKREWAFARAWLHRALQEPEVST